MSLIPVIDLLNGQVVHAVGGERACYREFEDSRFEFDRAEQLIELWIREFSPELIYIADLNAIEGSGDHLQLIRRWGQLETRFLFDFGLRNWQDYWKLNAILPESLNWTPVFGSESVESFAALASASKQDKLECFVSLDIKNQKVLGAATQCNPLSQLCELIELEFQNIIVLDLDAVGTEVGQNNGFIPMDFFSDHTSTRFFKGGGVQDVSEFNRLIEMGYQGVLSSTALHRGTIQGSDSKANH